MARITVEDCIQRVPNRFHLVQVTAIRAKQIKRGSHTMIAAGENKEVVTALREIAGSVPTLGEAILLAERFRRARQIGLHEFVKSLREGQ